MKRRYLITAFLIGLTVYSATSSEKKAAFSLAENFPRGALVYAETSDLPGMLRSWTSSGLHQKYQGTTNFRQLQNRHLGLKLASRWQEFSDAAGFPFDLAAVAGLSHKRAGIGIYDIGKLEFVFIAPMAAEIFAATRFMGSPANFSEEQYEAESVLRVSIKADRGRQRQELIVSHQRSHLIAATSEQLFIRTVANLKKASTADRLSAQPEFSKLAGAIDPGPVAIWLDLSALNADYYFKRYFLLAARQQSAGLISAVATIYPGENILTERRAFLRTTTDPEVRSVAGPDEILSQIPEGTSYLKLHRTNAADAADNVVETILGASFSGESEVPPRIDLHTSYHEQYYGSFEDSYEETIGEEDEAEAPAARTDAAPRLVPILDRASPNALAVFSGAETSSNPIFPGFRRGTVLRLASAASLDVARFEETIIEIVKASSVVPNGGAKLRWQSIEVCGLTARRLSLPLLGRETAYYLSGSILKITNSPDLLCNSPAKPAKAEDHTRSGPFHDLTRVDVKAAREGYARVFSVLASGPASDDLFTGNIHELVGSAGLSSAERRSWRRNDVEFENIVYSFE